MTFSPLARLTVLLTATFMVAVVSVALTRTPTNAVEVADPYVAGLYGGVHAADGVVLILLLPDGTVYAYAEGVPLAGDCAPDTVDVVVQTEFREDGAFTTGTTNGGIGAQQLPEDDVEPTRFNGTLEAFLPGGGFECHNSGIMFSAILGPRVSGDVNCSYLLWPDSEESHPQGGPDLTPVNDLVDEDDMIFLLLGLAGAAPPPIDGCPATGEEDSNGVVWGDLDCDGDVDGEDALIIPKKLAGVPVPDPPAPCPPVQRPYNPGTGDPTPAPTFPG